MKPLENFIAQPVRSLQTMLRTVARTIPDCCQVIPDGIYGPQTMRAVTAFQQQHRLPVTGVANQQTWEQISEAYQTARTQAAPPEVLQLPRDALRDLGPGGKGHALYLVQAMLLAMADVYGAVPVPPLSGTLDDATQEALSAFQRLSGLPVSGCPDHLTWKAMVLQFTSMSIHQKL